MMFLRHFRKSYYSAKWPPFVFVKNLIESPGASQLSSSTWHVADQICCILSYWASQNMSHMWDIMWLCPLIYFHFTTTDCCDIVRTNSLLEVVHWVNILQESVIVSSHSELASLTPGVLDAELRNILFRIFPQTEFQIHWNYTSAAIIFWLHI